MDSFALGNALMAGGQGLGQLSQGMFKDQVDAANRVQQAGLSHAKMQAQQDAMQSKEASDQKKADAANQTRIQAAQIVANAATKRSSQSDNARVTAAGISAAARVKAAALSASSRSAASGSKQVSQQIEDTKSALAQAQKQLDAANAAVGKGSPVDPGYAQLKAQAAQQQEAVTALKTKLSQMGDRNFPAGAAGAGDFPGAIPVPTQGTTPPQSPTPQQPVAPPQASTPASSPALQTGAQPATAGGSQPSAAPKGGAPYPDGTRLTGPGGKIFIVQNGVPVPYGG